MSNRRIISRRRFLIGTAGVLGVAALAAGGGLAAVASSNTAVDFGRSNYSGQGGAGTILVAYASHCGSTAEIAEAIGMQLGQRGAVVEVRNVAEVTDLSPYSAVVLGSAVRMGSSLPAAVEFVEAQAPALRKLPVAFFAVHILALDDSEASRAQRAAYLEPLKKVVTPQNEAFFAGKVDPATLGPAEAFMSKAVGSPEGDLRDWSAIRAWADKVFTA